MPVSVFTPVGSTLRLWIITMESGFTSTAEEKLTKFPDAWVRYWLLMSVHGIDARGQKLKRSVEVLAVECRKSQSGIRLCRFSSNFWSRRMIVFEEQGLKRKTLLRCREGPQALPGDPW